MLTIKNYEFIKSAANSEGFIIDDRFQVAIAGRSNVGKSSFINMILNDRGAARVSSTPGRTTLINYFDINKGELILTDLPGYGYAKVSKSLHLDWGVLVGDYFKNTKKLCVISMVDIRHTPTTSDCELINFLYASLIPFLIVANKADKQSKMQNIKSLNHIATTLKVGVDNIIMTSCLKKTGIENVLEKIGNLQEVMK